MTELVAVREAVRWPGARFIAPAAGLAGMALLTALFLWRREAYFAALVLLGFNPLQVGTLDQTPFSDAVQVLSSAQCWRQGVNVFTINPCEPMGRSFVYPPLMLLLLPPHPGWAAALGLAQGAAFFLSLAFLPWRKGLAPFVAAGALSPPAWYGVERGNLDLLIFMLAMLAGYLLSRERRRLLAYPVMLFGGMLKYYPFVLMALAIRERRMTLAAIAGLSAVAIGAAIGLAWPYLAEMRANIPLGFAPRDSFGADVLAAVLGCGLNGGDCTVVPPDAPASMLRTYRTVMAIGLAGTAGSTLLLLRALRLRAAMAALAAHEAALLMIGALTLVGCFFTGRSFAYREVFFLLTMPGLLSLGRRGGTAGAVAGAALAAIVFLMWSSALHNWLDLAAIDATSLFFVRELGFWWLVSFLLAVILAGLAGPRPARARP